MALSNTTNKGSRMYATPEQRSKATQSSLDVLLGMAGATLASVEQLTVLNLHAAHASLESTVTTARSVLSAKDPGELAGLADALSQPLLERVVAYSQSTYEIAAELQFKLGQLADTQIAGLDRDLSHSLDAAAKMGPPGAELAASMKSALATANLAYEAINTAVKQIAEIAKKNVDAIVEAG